MAIPKLGNRAATRLFDTRLFPMAQHSPQQRAENYALAKWGLDFQVSRARHDIQQEWG